jgi:hypothetical protein
MLTVDTLNSGLINTQAHTSETKPSKLCITRHIYGMGWRGYMNLLVA